MIRANIMRYRGAGISPPELQSACLNSVVTSTKRDNLTDFGQASSTFLLPLNKGFISRVQGLFRVFAAFNDLAVA